MPFYGNKRIFFHKKRVQLPQDLFGTPIWPPWRHVNTLYKITMRPLYCHGCAVLVFLFEASLHFVFKESMCCQFKTVSRHLLISFLLSSFLLVPNPKYSNLFLFFFCFILVCFVFIPSLENRLGQTSRASKWISDFRGKLSRCRSPFFTRARLPTVRS